MPKQTFTISDFSGGLNEISDSTDLQKSNNVVYAESVDFAARGFVSSFPLGRSFDDQIGNSTSLTIVDLDTQIGGAGGDNLGVNVAAVTTATDDLSWEDGIYDFKYTVCKNLGNGIIEEGPLQAFQDATIDSVACDSTSVDMSTDDLGKFTFKHEGTTFPSWKAVGSIIGRVYYSRHSGQGASTQAGWIHLCDLIYGIDSGNHDRIRPRAVGLTGNPANNIIDIEEPPTSASFEMNAGYPSDVGIHDATGDLGTITSVVTIGLVKYAAATSGSTFYIYRNIPGQPDIWPTDNWIDMTAYGACLAMLDSGNLLVYFTLNNVVLFDVTKDTVVKTFYGMGVANADVPAKCGQDIVWSTGESESSANDLTIRSRVFIFNGNDIKEITKNRIIGVNNTTAVAYNSNSGYLRFQAVYGASGIFYYAYNTTLDYWTGYNLSGGFRAITLPTITMGDPSRMKKIYYIIISCKDFDATHSNFLADSGFVKNEDGTDIKTYFSPVDTGGNAAVYKANQTVKVMALSIKTLITSSNWLSSVSIVFRHLRKFED